MQFEWDQQKSDATLPAGVFGFDAAALIFAGITLEPTMTGSTTEKLGSEPSE